MSEEKASTFKIRTLAALEFFLIVFLSIAIQDAVPLRLLGELSYTFMSGSPAGAVVALVLIILEMIAIAFCIWSVRNFSIQRLSGRRRAKGQVSHLARIVFAAIVATMFDFIAIEFFGAELELGETVPIFIILAVWSCIYVGLSELITSNLD